MTDRKLRLTPPPKSSKRLKAEREEQFKRIDAALERINKLLTQIKKKSRID